MSKAVIVVGGGLAGLTADSFAAKAANSGCQVTLFEKSQNVGANVPRLRQKPPGRFRKENRQNLQVSQDVRGNPINLVNPVCSGALHCNSPVGTDISTS